MEVDLLSKSLKNKWYKLFVFILIPILLTGCNPFSQKKDEAVKLPEIKQKYSEEQVAEFNNRITYGKTNRYEGLTISNKPMLSQPEKLPNILYYQSDVQIDYPKDGVRGIYVTADNVANPEVLDNLIAYINDTELNAMVIDFKDDYGNIVANINSDNKMVQDNVISAVDMKTVIKKLEANNIYPIARIVTFKDHMLSDDRPDLSFHDSESGQIWQDGNGAQFVNPFSTEVWDYNVNVAIEAAKLGFKDIQFDYVRFPEGFDVFGSDLQYDIGSYSYFITDNPDEEGIERVIAISDFLTYASEQLKPYGVEISADVFGYTAIASNAADVRGIGQDFARMSERVDVMSSMIYPSHWGDEFFGIYGPDLHPYEVVTAYMDHEKKLFENVENNVRTRPWIQDFTLPVPSGLYMTYGPNEVQAQINALYNQGIHEYLIWNASGEYTQGVDYAPENTGNTAPMEETTVQSNF